MAYLAPMTLDDLQQAIYALNDQGQYSLTSSDEDYVVRTALINNWISRWANVGGTLWNELWGTMNSQTYSVGTATYPASASFKFAAGYVRLVKSNGTTLYIQVLKPQQVQLMGTNDLYAYFTGRPGVVNLVLNGVSTDYAGATITYDYYRFATKLASSSDTPDLGDPYMLVYGVVSQLKQAQRDNAGYTINKTEAEERLKQMQIRNEMDPHYQDQGLEDVDYLTTGAGFGY
jgi:hypothetical protein